MTVFNHVGAEINAKKLEKIILECMKEGDVFKKFAKKHLYQWYMSECSQAVIEPNHEIFAAFED
jgi:hypothetical protein